MQEVQFIIQLSLLSSAVFHVCFLTYTSEVKFSSAYVCWWVGSSALLQNSYRTDFHENLNKGLFPAQKRPRELGGDLDKETDPQILSNFLWHCEIFLDVFVNFTGTNAWKIRLIQVAGNYYWVQSAADPKKSQSGFQYVLFDIELGLIEFKGTVGPWRRHALLWKKFWLVSLNDPWCRCCYVFKSFYVSEF